MLLQKIGRNYENYNIIGRDGSFIKYTTGVVYDKKTDLEWVAGSDKNTTWYEAKSWVENLNVAGGGWQMPIRAELNTLYKKGVGTRNMTPLLKTTGWWVWSGETKSSRRLGASTSSATTTSPPETPPTTPDGVLRCVPEDNDRLFGYLIIRVYRGIYPLVRGKFFWSSFGTLRTSSDLQGDF
jgi:hypothetical protein